jgi:hypothetical protein
MMGLCPVTAATDDRSLLTAARRRYFRQYVAVLVAVWLTYIVDTAVIPHASGNTAGWRLLVALLSVAAVAVLGWAATILTKSTRTARASYLGLSESDLPGHRTGDGRAYPKRLEHAVAARRLCRLVPRSPHRALSARPAHACCPGLRGRLARW